MLVNSHGRRRAPGNGVRGVAFSIAIVGAGPTPPGYGCAGQSPCRHFSLACACRWRPRNAACAPDPASSGQTVTLQRQTPRPAFRPAAGVDNLTVNVLPGATVSDGGGGVIIGVNDFNTVTNSGTLTAGPK